MAHRTSRLAAAAASLLLAMAALSACAAETTGGADPTPTTQAETTDATPIPTVTASPTAAQVEIPDDCRAILNASVLAELADVPLNDPAFGPSGLQSDGSLICV